MMYTTAFVLGFFTSFGWWTAGKIQKTIDTTVTQPAQPVELQQDKKE